MLQAQLLECSLQGPRCSRDHNLDNLVAATILTLALTKINGLDYQASCHQSQTTKRSKRMRNFQRSLEMSPCRIIFCDFPSCQLRRAYLYMIVFLTQKRLVSRDFYVKRPQTFNHSSHNCFFKIINSLLICKAQLIFTLASKRKKQTNFDTKEHQIKDGVYLLLLFTLRAILGV